jgi:hypothetical protein
MKELTFVIVKWGDAAENSDPDHDRIVEPIPILTTYSCGYLLFEDEHKITISRDFFPAPSSEHNDTVRKKLTIPKRGIDSLVKLKIGTDL